MCKCFFVRRKGNAEPVFFFTYKSFKFIEFFISIKIYHSIIMHKHNNNNNNITFNFNYNQSTCVHPCSVCECGSPLDLLRFKFYAKQEGTFQSFIQSFASFQIAIRRVDTVEISSVSDVKFEFRTTGFLMDNFIIVGIIVMPGSNFRALHCQLFRPL